VIGAIQVIALDVLIVVGAGLGLALVLRFGRAALDALPMSRARRALVARLRPLVGAALVVLYVMIAARWVLRTDDPRAWIALLVVGLILVAASWGPLRDVLEGVYLRAASALAVGDRVQIGAVRGRVQRLGYRSVHVEGTDGDLAILPYRAIAAQPILRSPAADHASFHVFRAPLPEHRSIPEARRVIRETALLCHWSSIARPPQVAATDDGDLEVTIFAIDADRAPEIERLLRRALAART
jgi:small-conductance mechanosensitive channel